MRRRRAILLLLVGLLAAFGVWMFFLRNKEPSYQGRALSQWIEEAEEDDQVPEAIRQIGSKAIPYAQAWMSYAGPELSSEREEHRADLAMLVFKHLGVQGKQAIPTLTAWLDDGKSRTRTARAAQALAYIGPNGLPPLMACLASKERDVQTSCINAIATMGRAADPALPALLRCLQDANGWVRLATAATLRNTNVDATLVVPALAGALQDQDAYVRRSACLGLAAFKERARMAVPGLLEVLKDKDKRVLEAATNALPQIAPQALKSGNSLGEQR
jgi:HEAT repeat protein